MEFTMESAFWIFNMVSNFAYTRYRHIHPEIAKLQQEMEKNYIEQIAEVDLKAKELYQSDKNAAIQYVTDYSVGAGEQTFLAWKNLYGYLFTKYMDGNMKEPVSGEQNPKLNHPGYSNEWFEELVKQTGEQFKVIGPAGH
jgi:dipeptidase